MQAKILRAFPLSRDGIRAEMQEPGAVVDIPDELHPGLLKEGWVGPADLVERAADPLAIPDKGDERPRRGKKSTAE
jgi:hypothetical protein